MHAYIHSYFHIFLLRLDKDKHSRYSHSIISDSSSRHLRNEGHQKTFAYTLILKNILNPDKCAFIK